MPELPEVEGARKLVHANCVGKRILRAWVAEDEKVIQEIPPKELESALLGLTLVAAKRRGKQMWWELSGGGPALLIHFGMTGGLVIKGVGAAHYKSFAIDDSSWPPKYCKLEAEFEDGTTLAFCDARRFARVRWIADPEANPPISLLGWDPLLAMQPLAQFGAALGRERRAIKALLLDQSFAAGIGNWVADEVLYQSRVHPEQPAYSLTPEQVEALHSAVDSVCRLACACDADASHFPDTWLFHLRWGKGSGTVARIGGHAIDHITVGGRTSAYVPALQKLSKAAIAAAAAPTGRKAAGGGSKKQKGAAAAAPAPEAAAPQQAGAAARKPASGAGRGSNKRAATADAGPAEAAAEAPPAPGGTSRRAAAGRRAGQAVAAAPETSTGRSSSRAAVGGKAGQAHGAAAGAAKGSTSSSRAAKQKERSAGGSAEQAGALLPVKRTRVRK